MGCVYQSDRGDRRTNWISLNEVLSCYRIALHITYEINRVYVHTSIMTSIKELQPTKITGDMEAIVAEDLQYQLIWLDPYKDTEYVGNQRAPRFDTHSEIEVSACLRVLELIGTEEEWDLENDVVILTRSEEQKEIIEENVQIPNEPEGVTVIPVCTLHEWSTKKKPVVIFSFGECMFDEENKTLVNTEVCDDNEEVEQVLNTVDGFSTRLIIVGHKEYVSTLNKYWKAVADLCSDHIIETYN